MTKVCKGCGRTYTGHQSAYKGYCSNVCYFTPKGGQTQPQMGIKVRIWWDEKAQSYIFTYTYGKPQFIDAIKQFIPSGSRDYDPTTKFWYIKEGYEDFVRKMAESSFGLGSVSFTSRTVTQQSQQAYTGQTTQRNGNTTEQAIVDFFNLVPFDVAKRCYLLTAQQLHPDKGGDPQKMSRLNELWDRLEKEFFKR